MPKVRLFEPWGNRSMAGIDCPERRVHVSIGEKRKFFLDLAIKSVENEEDGTLVIEGYASTYVTDRDKEAVTPQALKGALDRFMQNPVLLLQHDADQPIGRIIEATIDDVGLFVKAVVTSPVADWAKEAYQKIKDGVYKAFSIGGLFTRIKNAITEMDLMEISVVTIPSNPTALFEVAQKAFSLKALPAGATGETSLWGDAPEGSYDDLREDLQALVRGMFAGQVAYDPYAYDSYYPRSACLLWVAPDDPKTIPAGYAMVAVPSDDGDQDYYEVAYTIGDDGEPVLGESREVSLVYVPVANDVQSGGMALSFKPKDGSAPRNVKLRTHWESGGGAGSVKQGRVLSQANLDKITQVLDLLQSVVDQVSSAMETDPAKT